jgi:hypothetical protein
LGNPQLFHLNPQLINRRFGGFFLRIAESLSDKAVQPDNICGKKKNQKIWAVNVEKCYFVGITGKIGSIP